MFAPIHPLQYDSFYTDLPTAYPVIPRVIFILCLFSSCGSSSCQPCDCQIQTLPHPSLYSLLLYRGGPLLSRNIIVTGFRMTPSFVSPGSLSSFCVYCWLHLLLTSVSLPFSSHPAPTSLPSYPRVQLLTCSSVPSLDDFYVYISPE